MQLPSRRLLLGRLAGPLATVALALALTPPAAADVEVHLAETMAIPVARTLDADLFTALGVITGHLEFAHAENGRLITGGPSHVDGTPVELKGRVKLNKKTGLSTLVVKATNKDVGLKLSIKADLADGIVPIGGSYKGPLGKGKVPKGEFTVLMGADEGAESTLDVTFASEPGTGDGDGDETVTVGDKGELTVLAADLQSAFENLDPADPTEVTAKLKNDTLLLKAKRGKARYTFKGKWDGAQYLGNLKLRLLPEKRTVKGKLIPGFVAPQG